MIRGPKPPLSNSLPDVAVAVHTHRVHLALTAEHKARAERRLRERHAAEAGIPIGGVRRARAMLSADPEKLERQERETAMILTATRAGVQVEQPSLFEATTDQSDEARDQRLRHEGYSAAIWCHPRDGGDYSDKDDRTAWMAGFDQFAADAAAFSATENKKRGRK